MRKRYEFLWGCKKGRGDIQHIQCQIKRKTFNKRTKTEWYRDLLWKQVKWESNTRVCKCYEMRWGLRAYWGAGGLVRTWLQLMCCATRCLLSLNFGQGFRGSDEEFKGQSMAVSDWGTYMKFGTYIYRNRAYCIRVTRIGHISGLGFRDQKIEQGEWKCEVEWKHETKWSSETWNAGGNGVRGWMSKQSKHDDK